MDCHKVQKIIGTFDHDEANAIVESVKRSLKIRLFRLCGTPGKITLVCPPSKVPVVEAFLAGWQVGDRIADTVLSNAKVTQYLNTKASS